MSVGSLIRAVTLFVGLLTSAAGVLVWCAVHLSLGTQFEVFELQAVYYSGDAQEEDARQLAEALKETGYFDGSIRNDVLLRKTKEQTVLSFVVQDGIWDQPEYVEGFRTLAAQLADAVGGTPLTVQLIDANRKVHREMECREAMLLVGAWRPITELEKVNYSGRATEQDAAALGAALQESGYFAGTHAMDVLLRKTERGTTIAFVLQDGFWESAENVAAFRELGKAVAPSLGGAPLTVQLADQQLHVKKFMRVE